MHEPLTHDRALAVAMKLATRPDFRLAHSDLHAILGVQPAAP